MLTRREEDILILEIEEKNTELLKEWVEGKEGKRDGSDRRGQQGNGQQQYNRNSGGEEREVTGVVQPS